MTAVDPFTRATPTYANAIRFGCKSGEGFQLMPGRLQRVLAKIIGRGL